MFTIARAGFVCHDVSGYVIVVLLSVRLRHVIPCRMAQRWCICNMQGKCTFGKRLDDQSIQQLADYTLQQAASGWK